MLCSCHTRDKGVSQKHVKLWILQSLTVNSGGVTQELQKVRLHTTTVSVDGGCSVVSLALFSMNEGYGDHNTTSLPCARVVGSSCQIHSNYKGSCV